MKETTAEDQVSWEKLMTDIRRLDLGRRKQLKKAAQDKGANSERVQLISFPLSLKRLVFVSGPIKSFLILEVFWKTNLILSILNLEQGF